MIDAINRNTFCRTGNVAVSFIGSVCLSSFRFDFFFLSVCDNCTLTLLARTDELTEILREGSSHIDLSGVPAPWPRLMSFENQSVFMEQRVDDFFIVQTYVEEFDDDVIEKVRRLTVYHSPLLTIASINQSPAPVESNSSQQETAENLHQNRQTKYRLRACEKRIFRLSQRNQSIDMENPEHNRRIELLRHARSSHQFTNGCPRGAKFTGQHSYTVHDS